mgnify:CR=1 FL=1
MNRKTQNLLTELESTRFDHKIAVGSRDGKTAHIHELREIELLNTLIPLLNADQLEELWNGCRQHLEEIFLLNPCGSSFDGDN